MTLASLSRAATLATLIAAGMPAAATEQTTAADPHRPGMTLAQAMPPSGMMSQGMGAQPGQSGMMCGMMQPGMMGQGMMGMPGPVQMKIFFAIADANGDGGLSFDEVTAIHKRIVDRVDADKDGKVTPGNSGIPPGVAACRRHAAEQRGRRTIPPPHWALAQPDIGFFGLHLLHERPVVSPGDKTGTSRFGQFERRSNRSCADSRGCDAGRVVRGGRAARTVTARP
jgi:hypothetical protein